MNSLYHQLASYDLLLKSFKKICASKPKRKWSSSRGCDDISIEEFYINQQAYIMQLQKLLITKKYKHSDLFGYEQPKQEANKYRLIACATIGDRIIHKSILGLIYQSLYPYINTGVSYCGVKNPLTVPDNEEANEVSDQEIKNTSEAIKVLAKHISNKNFFILKCDIEKFYDTIPKSRMHSKVKELTQKYLHDDSLDIILRQIIFFRLSNEEKFKKEPFQSLLPQPGLGIPQGSSLSQLLANIYLVDFDHGMKDAYGNRFIRYIDDFIVICNSKEERNEAEQLAHKLLTKLKLSLSPKKTIRANLKDSHVNFLGLRISEKGIKAKETEEELKKWILDILNPLNRAYKKTKNDQEKVTKMNKKILGKGNYLRFYHTQENYTLLNKYIKIKKQENKKLYKKIELLDQNKITPIISIKEWQSYFK